VSLFISYWRSNFIKATRVMLHRENATPETVMTIPLIWDELSNADVQQAKKALKQLKVGGAALPRSPETVTEGEVPSSARHD
jgi:hypothetical protein